jgi:hypothetical protein
LLSPGHAKAWIEGTITAFQTPYAQGVPAEQLPSREALAAALDLARANGHQDAVRRLESASRMAGRRNG